MNVLIDSHTLMWSYFEPNRLSSTVRAILSDPANEVFVSPASYWEIAIKISTTKLKLRETFAEFVQHAIHDNFYTILPIEPRHAEAMIGLPFHHKDPFDRIMIAQAIVEVMPIISIDSVFDQYPVTRIW